METAQYLSLIRLEDFINFTTDAVIGINLEQRIFLFNLAAERIFGYRSEEMLGQPIDLVIPQRFVEILCEDTQAFEATPEAVRLMADRKEVSGRRKDGSEFPMHASIVRIVRGEDTAFMVFIRDISQRMKVEQDLIKWVQAFERAEWGVVIVEADATTLETMNPAFARLYGYTIEELKGKPIQDIYAPQERSKLPDWLREAQEKSHIAYEAIHLRKDGTIFPALVDTSTVKDPQGKVLYCVINVQDISERKQGEQALRESQRRYESIIAAMEEGIILQGLDGMIQTCNASAEKILGLSEDQMMGRTSKDPRWRAIHEDGSPFPGETHPAMVTLRTGQPCSNVIMGVHKPDETLTWISINTQPLFNPDATQPYAVVSSFTDISERRIAEIALREQEALLRKVLEVLPVGVWILDQNGLVLSGNPAGQKIWGGARYVGIDQYGEYRGWWADSGELIKPGEWAATRAIIKGEICLDEVVNIQGFDGAYKTILNSAIPLRDLNQKVIGAIVVNQDITEQMLTYQVLEKRVAERTRGMSALLEVSRNVASTLELKPLLVLILQQLKMVVDYTNAGIVKLEGDDFVYIEHQGSIPRERMMQFRTPAYADTAFRRVFETRTPVVIGDLWAGDPWVDQQQEQAGPEIMSQFSEIHSWMGAPLFARDHMIGILRLDHIQPNFFTDEHIRLVTAFANQAAAAMENASLYEQAQELAGLEERQKLARELHDSVSQALYGIALGARTARALIERDPAKAFEPLDYCLSLAEAGLAEMRALIFELRPESLELEGLTAALSKQAAALRARHSLQVDVDLCEEPEVSLSTKEALYRITQEAFNNVVKHARASRVDLRLFKKRGRLILEVCDDGQSFDASGAHPGHLGLRSMRERIERAGGSLEIESAPGKGTRITARVPVTPA
jgi:PAS domain S-box-containing protein